MKLEAFRLRKKALLSDHLAVSSPFKLMLTARCASGTFLFQVGTIAEEQLSGEHGSGETGMESAVVGASCDHLCWATKCRQIATKTTPLR